MLGGVPESWPVRVLNVAHEGLFTIPKVNARLDGFVTCGVYV